LADGFDIIYLDKVEGDRGRANSSDPGRRIPMYAAASGLAVLAFYPPELADPIVTRAAEAGYDAEHLKQELMQIRSRISATTERGRNTRISSVAAPVWGLPEHPIASLVLTSDSATLSASDYERIGSIVINAAEQVSQLLGGKFRSIYNEAP